MATIAERVAAEMEAEKNLMRRFGDEHERQWADDPNGPRVGGERAMTYVIGAWLDHRPGRPSRPGWTAPEPTPDDAQDALMQVKQARLRLDGLERNLIAAARDLGLTWKQVAEAIGLESPQAAQLRYAQLDGGTG